MEITKDFGDLWGCSVFVYVDFDAHSILNQKCLNLVSLLILE